MDVEECNTFLGFYHKVAILNPVKKKTHCIYCDLFMNKKYLELDFKHFTVIQSLFSFSKKSVFKYQGIKQPKGFANSFEVPQRSVNWEDRLTTNILALVYIHIIIWCHLNSSLQGSNMSVKGEKLSTLVWKRKENAHIG